MIDFVYYFVLVLEIVLLVSFERRKWGTLVTPFNMLAILFGIVSTLAIVYSWTVPGVKNFYLPSLIVWIIGLAFFYVPAALLPVKRKRQNYYEIDVSRNKYDPYKALFAITLFVGMIALLKVRSAAGAGGGEALIGTDEFSENYDASGGLLAHLSMFLSIMFAYFMYKLDKRHKLAIIPIVLILVIQLAQASKTHILTPLIMGLFTRVLTGKTKLSLRIIVIAALAGAGVFFGIYFIALVLSGATDSYEVYLGFVSKHFLVYFLGGSLSFSLDYQMGIKEPIMTEQLYAPFIAVWEKITGITSAATVDNPIFMDMGELGSTNVRTFFGTMYAYSHSYTTLIITSLFIGFVVYFVYYLSYSKKNIFLAIATSANLTYLIFGAFFDYYWLHIYAYEIIVICLMLCFFTSFKHETKVKTASAAS